MGRRSRDKGADFERGVAIALRPVWPGSRRGIGQARSGGEVPDVDGTPWWIEAKNRKRVCIARAYQQAAAATDGRPSLSITRENRGPILVTMALADFLDRVGRERPPGRPSLSCEGPARCELGPDEQRVVAEVTRRLELGRGIYGQLDLAADRRDMQREATEELLDACVYLAAELLRRGGEGRER